jgi:hypothetical protein
MTTETFADEVGAELDAILRMLIEKNRRYGDSALSPARIFSRADATEQIRVRIDYGLSRLAAQEHRHDVGAVFELLGDLVLLQIAERRRARGAPCPA